MVNSMARVLETGDKRVVNDGFQETIHHDDRSKWGSPSIGCYASSHRYLRSCVNYSKEVSPYHELYEWDPGQVKVFMQTRQFSKTKENVQGKLGTDEKQTSSNRVSLDGAWDPGGIGFMKVQGLKSDCDEKSESELELVKMTMGLRITEYQCCRNRVWILSGLRCTEVMQGYVSGLHTFQKELQIMMSKLFFS